MAFAQLRMIVLLGLLLIPEGSPKHAQTADAIPDNQYQYLGDADLDLLLGPIALYPDPLLAVLLPAATQPSDIVRAVRYINNGGPIDQIDAQPWSDSTKALARYTDVIRWMDENLDWTTDLGEAFQMQPEDVMNTIQRLRRLAQYLGHLIPTPEQTIETDEGIIEILPANSNAISVPWYEADYLFTHTSSAHISPVVRFGRSTPVASWFKYDWDWGNRRVVIWGKEQPRPQNWWAQPRAKRFGKEAKFTEWCPKARPNQARFWRTRQQMNVIRPASVSTAGHSAGRIAPK
jgi:hypothetical protein